MRPCASALGLFLAIAGCVTNAPLDPPALDRAMFESRVQPVLAARCASPVCHGSERRPLRVYAPGFLRRDAARTHLDEPLSEAEVLANARSAEAFALGTSAAECLLVTKPTARVSHTGGRVLPDDDGDLAILVAWLRTREAP